MTSAEICATRDREWEAFRRRCDGVPTWFIAYDVGCACEELLDRRALGERPAFIDFDLPRRMADLNVAMARAYHPDGVP